MANREEYYQAMKAFDNLDLNEQIKFINNNTDILIKRALVNQKNGFLVIRPREETHIIPIEYNQENHYATVILQNSPFIKINWEEDKRERFLLTSEDSQTPAELILFGKRCWIKQGELDKILSKNIDIDKIKVVTYREGVLSPYKTTGSISKLIDGYELEFIWND